MNPKVDNYLEQGCMRCKLGGTHDCKVHAWTAELEKLREIVLDCGLTEELKWGVPCYTFNDGNVLMVSALKNYSAISFFKGVLLKDPDNILEKPGPNSQSARLIKFTNVNEIPELEPTLNRYIYEAIEVEKAGLKVNFKKNPEPIPEELERKFEEDPVLKSAFESLTPGRQRGYIIYFSQPKQSETRESRIEKCAGKILNGEGLHDKYSGRRK
ncbi:YdeI/OmpD-associated family protein [Ulvibacterium sp.]|uniref:YdeI/OmpD-associated family protein n=1 Tax=Ulvibacterium sp. TaxID=2665914 RepID=UPI003BA90589